MHDLVDNVRSALGPYVGNMAADTCIRATALSVGKTADELGSSDLPAIESNIRRLLLPVAPQSVVESIISGVRGTVTTPTVGQVF